METYHFIRFALLNNRNAEIVKEKNLKPKDTKLSSKARFYRIGTSAAKMKSWR